MSTVLIVGATRGLGLCLAKQYSAKKDVTVFGTSRANSAPEEKGIQWITNVDLMSPSVGSSLVKQLGAKGIGGDGGGTASGTKPFDIVVSSIATFVSHEAKR